jgi:hypothetical protein
MGEGGKPPLANFWGLFTPPPPRPFFPQINRAPPPPDFFARAKRAKASKASKFALEARIKMLCNTFETCRSSDLSNYMIFYIIIWHMGNKIQILLDIDGFFSFFSKKTQFFYFLKCFFYGIFYFLKKIVH